MLSQDTSLFDAVAERLSAEYGPVDLEGPVWPWEHTTYYEKEMGGNLKRKFIFFQKLISPGHIASIKLETNELERQFLNEQGGRRINLDPGYLDSSKLVLVTTKNYSHRIYLRDGIYGEVTLIFRKGEFQPLPYTYRDYASQEYRELFCQARGYYNIQRSTS
jgi:hypothetical protein